MTDTVIALAPERASLVERTASRYGVEPAKMLNTLKATAFRASGDSITNEQMMALLIVAERHGLDPFTKEIYAYPDKRGGIVPVVGVDGWVRIVQEHPQFDGWEFEYDEKLAACTCTIWRKDRSRPTRLTEYLSECKRNTDAWNGMPRRMLRHKALMQCARIAFGFAGIHDDDEAEDIARGATQQASVADRVREVLKRRPEPVAATPVDDVIDMDTALKREPLSAFDNIDADTLDDYMHDMQNAADADAGAEVLDRARTDQLPEPDYQALVSAYRARFTPESGNNGN